jgi:hypothetical protein
MLGSEKSDIESNILGRIFKLICYIKKKPEIRQEPNYVNKKNTHNRILNENPGGKTSDLKELN